MLKMYAVYSCVSSIYLPKFVGPVNIRVNQWLALTYSVDG